MAHSNAVDPSCEGVDGAGGGAGCILIVADDAAPHTIFLVRDPDGGSSTVYNASSVAGFWMTLWSASKNVTSPARNSFVPYRSLRRWLVYSPTQRR